MTDSKKLPFAFSMKFDTRDAASGEVLQERHEKTFSIAMIGNFGGVDETFMKADTSAHNIIEIDRYNYDEVLASTVHRFSLSLQDDSGRTADIPLHSLKDFEPDNLYKNTELFSQLRGLRKRLNNPSTFKQVMKEIGIEEEEALLLEEPVPPEQPPQREKSERPRDEPAANLLDSILEETENRSKDGAETVPSTAHPVRESSPLIDAFVRQVVAGRKTVSRDSRQDEMIAAIDDTIAQQMRRLLHHPEFQALEAAWRAVSFMVKRVRSGKKVKLYLLDVSRDELASDLAAADVTQTKLYKVFCDTSLGDISWNLIIGDYRFGADIDDILLLSQLGAIAQQAGAHFIAAADETLVGCKSFAETPDAGKWAHEISHPVAEGWTLLRKSPVAKNVSLALPRFMLRAPYGSNATPVKSFKFEEMSDRPEHADYLWGNPAFLKAEQISRAFIEDGLEMQLAKVMNVEDMPIHYYQENGQTRIKPCAEIPLTDTGASKMIALGLIPLWSVKNRDRIHSGDFHSIGEAD